MQRNRHTNLIGYVIDKTYNNNHVTLDHMHYVNDILENQPDYYWNFDCENSRVLSTSCSDFLTCMDVKRDGKSELGLQNIYP